MRHIALLTCLMAPILAACSMEPVINHQVVDYFDASAIASNQTILQNILRAKDGAPLHFGEFADIRGSLSTNLSVSSTVPFGPIGFSTTKPRNLLTAGATVASSPSFDIDSLDTQDFTKGVMSPITPDNAEFFLNDGIDYRMVLMLLISGVRPPGSEEMLLNAPNSARVVCYAKEPAQNAVPADYVILAADQACAGFSEPEYYAFLRTINNVGRLYPVTITGAPKPVGAPFALDMAKDLKAVASIDPTKYTLAHTKSGLYQLMSAKRSSTIILCSDSSGSPMVAGSLVTSDAEAERIPADACSPTSAANQTGGDTDLAPQTPVAVAKNAVVFKLRSTLEVIQYVGQVMAFQEQQTSLHPDRPERCVTLEYENLNGPTCNGGVLFHLENTGPNLPDPANSVSYNGETWSLPAPQVCTDPDRCDHTLQTLSMISLLLNENKSAKDIGLTQAVQVVP